MIDQIIAYENGELTDDETIDLFQNLVNSGMIYALQGHYWRVLCSLVEQGLVKAKTHN